MLVEREKISECQVTITHSEKIGISIVSDPRFVFGIDLEWKNQWKSDSIHNFFSEKEQELLKISNENKLELLFWSSKEALGKYLGIGLSADPIIFEITNVKQHKDFYEVSFRNFLRHKVLGYQSPEFVLAVAYYDRVSRKSIESLVESISYTIESRIRKW